MPVMVEVSPLHTLECVKIASVSLGLLLVGRTGKVLLIFDSLLSVDDLFCILCL